MSYKYKKKLGNFYFPSYIKVGLEFLLTKERGILWLKLLKKK